MRLRFNLSFRTKLAAAIVTLLLLLGFSFTFLVERQITPRLEEELEKQGVAIARDLAIRSLAPVLTQDIFTLQELIQDTIQFNKEVRYIFLVDPSGRVLAHSFSGEFPSDLRELSHILPAERYLMELLDTEEGLIRDIAVPLYPGKMGAVHLGMSERYIMETLAKTRVWLYATTATILIPGILAAYYLARRLTRPIWQLVKVTQAVSRGDLYQQAPTGSDEIGQLGNAFNYMTKELRRFTAEIKGREERKGELLEKVISAQEEERKRISRELHDETSQYLMSVLVGLKLAQTSPTLKEAKKRLKEARTLTQKAFNEVRQLAFQLRPSVLDDLGLEPALQSLLKDYSSRFNVTVDSQFHWPKERLPPQVETLLYRVIQEALTNVVKHAQASRAMVYMDREGDMLKTVVSDDGKGFNAAQVLEAKDGNLGLLGIQERVSLVGGRWTVESATGKGTRLTVEVPLSTQEKENE